MVGRVEWAQRLQAIAQSGLAYDPAVFDRQRYEQVRRVAAEMLARDEREAAALDGDFAREIGQATPKIDVRGVVFRDDEILLVHERADGRWTLPGGWADVGESPGEAVAREVREESGYEARPVRLLALYDRARHGPPHRWHAWKAFFECELDGAAQGPLDVEVLDARFFPRDGLPELSVGRVTPAQIARFFEHRDHPEWPADFD